ncbi:MAG TPA: carboxypeptidase-like regulatory domain-containing protein, partial [Ginsengibacter sp.]|nr:carboxypeptidase-like regulatory domain-containing protein [Ginsengibacter sp.]
MRTYLLLVAGMVLSLGTLAQSRIQVKGTVTSQNGTPIPASVVVKGTTAGVSADAEGHYTLQNVASNAVLIFSSVGYQTQEVAVNGRTQVDAVMVDDAQQLDEVIMVAYGSSTKETFTGSASVVKGGDIKDIPATSFESALVG